MVVYHQSLSQHTRGLVDHDQRIKSNFSISLNNIRIYFQFNLAGGFEFNRGNSGSFEVDVTSGQSSKRSAPSLGSRGSSVIILLLLVTSLYLLFEYSVHNRS
jgi:hypothetical protein